MLRYRFPLLKVKLQSFPVTLGLSLDGHTKKKKKKAHIQNTSEGERGHVARRRLAGVLRCHGCNAGATSPSTVENIALRLLRDVATQAMSIVF